uniref:protein APEM9 n=1 Tax=Erigeron canadensis TaxID=72917 RepID=UPI001CB93E54|nr:protein APEM9 [Erigeron canadensis]XP_043629108.1 protein APEM9 [Erigeron canadensis]
MSATTETSVTTHPDVTVTPVTSESIWQEIDLSESYLVSSMFEEASSTASRVLKRLRDEQGIIPDIELNDMLESAGMVFVQSLKELGRTSVIMTELTQLYGSLTSIPVQVFLAGACFQILENPGGAQKILEEFLSQWSFVDEQHYALASLEANTSYTKDSSSRFFLDIDAYLQVVEAYITLLMGILRGTDLAISWVEKAALPEDKRQEFLRRLHSMYSSKDTGSQASSSLTDENSSGKQAGKQRDENDAAKQAILRYSAQHVSTFWLFRNVNLKFGSVRFAVSNGSILLTMSVLLIYYFLRRKKYTITGILNAKALFVKKTIIDLWQLAFSYQVNPLAAVESLPNPTRISH